ncbi:hypothetical protein [Amycolatopsis orientalis]|uniref:hypothetical protein n=1 Tax=Amycolatopsis orientalis TaxID=31958 RepID=UPI000A5EC5BD|nr:hypothetical protein [Amycolatopsis orientalis]
MTVQEQARNNEQRTRAVAGLIVLGVVLGFLAAFVGRWAAEGLGGTHVVRAVVSESDFTITEGQNGPHTIYEVRAVTEDRRVIELPVGEEFRRGEPVVARLSSLTDRVLSVRGARAEVEAHHTGEKIAAMSLGGLLLAFGVLAMWQGRRLLPGRLGTARAVPSFLAGVVLASFVVLTPVGFGGTAYRPGVDPALNLWKYGREAGDPPAVGRGGTVVAGELTLRVTGIQPRPPEGAAAWLSDFHVLTLRAEARGLGDTSLKLSADEHGEPRRVDGCAGAPGAFDGTTGLVCFVVPPGYRTGYLLVGERGHEAWLTL